ncbi:hypothetical protein OSTOST_17233 [Ostertagia ostertagi]
MRTNTHGGRRTAECHQPIRRSFKYWKLSKALSKLSFCSANVILSHHPTLRAPIVVHCSAGVGRTGSMVLIQYILESISLGGPFEETDKTSEIRSSIEQHNFSEFMTDQQYLFVHMVLLNYFVENQLLDPRWKPFLDRFTREHTTRMSSEFRFL